MNQKTFIDYADAIDAAATGAELNVLSSLTSAYVKHAIMLEECESDYFGLSLIQEGEILDKAKGDGSESMLKRILLFIPRLIKAIYDKLVRSKKSKTVNTLAKTVKSDIENARKTAPADIDIRNVTIKARVPAISDDKYKNLLPVEPSSIYIIDAAIYHLAAMRYMMGSSPTTDQLKINEGARSKLTQLEKYGPEVGKAFNEIVDKYSKLEPSEWTFNLVDEVFPALDYFDPSTMSVSPDELIKRYSKTAYTADVFKVENQLEWIDDVNDILKIWSSQDEYKNDDQLLKAAEGLAKYAEAYGRYSTFILSELESSYRQIHAMFGGQKSTFKT